MYQVTGINTSKIYAQGSRADCLRTLGEKYPYIVSGKSGSKWGRGNIVTDKPVFKEPLRIVKTGGFLKGVN